LAIVELERGRLTHRQIEPIMEKALTVTGRSTIVARAEFRARTPSIGKRDLRAPDLEVTWSLPSGNE
jgi:hypothetical protein